MYAVQYMEQAGSFSYTRDVIRGLKSDTAKLVAQHGGNEAITAIVDYLAAKVFGASNLPRTPNRTEKPSLSAESAGDSESRMMLTLSSEYQE